NGAGARTIDDAADGAEDAPLNIDVVANDQAPPGGGPLTLQSVSSPEHGRATIADNRVAYQPAPDYHGPDAFTYTVTDARGAESTGTVHLTLASVDDKPEAVDDQATITDGGSTTVEVVANDRGLGDGLKAVTVTQPPAHGSAVVAPDQKIGYTPTGGFNGTDTLEYRVTDADDESSTGKVTITIGGANHVPIAVDDSVTTRSGRQTLPMNVTSNDDVADGIKEVRFADANGAPMDATDIGTAAGGIARRSGTKIAYTAPAGTFTGSDAFTYVVLDNDGDVSKPATVRATVVTNQAPQVKDGTVAVPQNRQAAGSIAKLGWDPEKDAITYSLRSSPAGQLTLKPDGSFLYEAPAGVDVDAFSFVANDGNSDSNVGNLSIEVTQAQAQAAPSSSTTTTGPSTATSSPSSSSSSTSATTGSSTSSPSSSTTSTTRKSTTSTTAKSSTTATTSKSSKSSTTSGQSKKPPSSNSRGKTTSTTSKSKAWLVPLLPLAAAPAVTRLPRRRRHRSRG
ncbi:MAG TPA: Ig-like domain-containing protein, partial [Acidimicrobiia bacterium]|nr:Ig-like domain-containing protein [Acidimicrobiia bacterium]